jgi:uncharacterized protein YbjQ (UPF0145 family)
MSTPYRNAELEPPPPVVVTTGSEIPGRRIGEILGVVRGIALRRPRSPKEHPLEPFMAVRQAAELRLIEEAKLLRAEAVIGMRYDSNDAEVVAYGTAVRLHDK